MPREPLGQKEVAAGSIYIRDRRVPHRVDAIEPIEPRSLLPFPKAHLHAPLRNAPPSLIAEAGVGVEGFTAFTLPPEPLQPVAARGRNTSPTRPPFAISARNRTRVRGVPSGRYTSPTLSPTIS
jgi:hypothetical protein